ncbi:MAG: hypothetical protein OSB00_10825 [Sphingomonas bacterium]|nr:hypothetical protein [Sphingomonas bacterium]
MITLLSMLAIQVAAPVIDVTRGPVATTTVAVRVSLDSEGRVVSCRTATAASGACVGFPKGRVVSSPIRHRSEPVGGMMTVSTTTVVSGR